LLKYALVIVLAFVAVKILLIHVFHIPALVSLGVILLVLGGGVFLSLRQNPTNIDTIDSSAPNPEHARLK
jgi:tellurite resistance protein TerC